MSAFEAPGWSEARLTAARAVSLGESQEDAERAILQAIAGHSRASLNSDGEPGMSVAFVVNLAQALGIVRHHGKRRED